MEPQNGGGGNGGGTVQRATLTVTVASLPADDAILTALGWQALPPAVTIEIVRADGTDRRSRLTDASGSALFDSLLEGRYRISAIRTLSATEIAQLPDSLRDVTGFGGGTTADIAAPSHASTISVVAGRRGSLVISEFHTGWWEVPPLGSYRYGAFVELYNNADTTVALDGNPGAPADIGIDTRRSRIAVPYIALNRVDIWDLREVAVPLRR